MIQEKPQSFASDVAVQEDRPKKCINLRVLYCCATLENGDNAMKESTSCIAVADIYSCDQVSRRPEEDTAQVMKGNLFYIYS